MSEPILFGISKSEWELINSFANWLSAIGTLAAVVVSLYLARRLSSPTVKLIIGHRVVVEPEVKGPIPEYIQFHIVNTGDRPIRVTGIGWKVGLWRKRQAVQMFESLMSSPLPIDLSHGQEAKWLVPLSARDETWLTYFAKGMLMPNYRLSCFSLRGQAFISTGRIFNVKPESGLLAKLRDACKELENK